MAKADDRLAKGLGWFSIALGTAELVAPKSIGRLVGVAQGERMIQACGMREIATGVGILASDDTRPWIWARLGGDAMDLAALGSGLRRDNPRRANVATAMAGVAAITALDAYCVRRHSKPQTTYDYSDRSGFPKAPELMRGTALPS